MKKDRSGSRISAKGGIERGSVGEYDDASGQKRPKAGTAVGKVWPWNQLEYASHL